MKARLTTEKQNPVFFDKDIILSISMIVKNEEKYLKNCLDALKPLLENIKSELVIIDTGSTDSTVDIARQYTKKVYNFEWISDFAAARNFGLQKCSGEWFMFLDADEIFTDVSEMIEFFNNNNINRKYNSAFYTIHNFATQDFDVYYISHARRIVRRTKELCFEGAIHEYFKNFSEPAYYFNTYVNHYGYTFQTEEEKELKLKRNLTPLEKELEKNPNDLRTIRLYVDCILTYNEKKISLIEKAFNIAKNSKTNSPSVFTAYFYMIYMQIEHTEDIDKALNILEEFQKRIDKKDALLIDIYALKGVLYGKQEQYSKATENIEKYLDYYDKYEKKLLDKSSVIYNKLYYYVPNERDKLKNNLILFLFFQNKSDEALGLLSETDFLNMKNEEYQNMIDTVIHFTSISDCKNLGMFYEKVYQTGNKEKIDFFDNKLEKAFYNSNNFFSKFHSCTLGFAGLMCLFNSEEDLSVKFNSFINVIEKFPNSYSELIYIALKNNFDLTVLLKKINFEELKLHITKISQYHIDFPYLVLKYQNEEFFTSNIENLHFGVILYETSLSFIKSTKNSNEYFTSFANYISLFICNIYNPALLNDLDIVILPETHRFGYYIAAAKKELESGNKLGYITSLKSALDFCPSMKDAIVFLLDDFSKTQL